ncbi:MAG: hypothetical protein U9N59_02055 [Campylobacterota bacterium]|nr:hypothetical protein [Campylobacterota bacterium]
MNELMFVVSLAVLITIFFSRHKIVEYLDEQFYIQLDSEIIVYILTVLFIAVIAAGMLLDDTKAKYSNISENYDKMRPKGPSEADKRPHRYFDVNTYD